MPCKTVTVMGPEDSGGNDDGSTGGDDNTGGGETGPGGGGTDPVDNGPVQGADGISNRQLMLGGGVLALGVGAFLAGKGSGNNTRTRDTTNRRPR